MASKMKTSRRIAIIGAGGAGLAALRRFTANEGEFQVVCFEALPVVSGMWNYCDNIDDPDHPTGSTYTAIYKLLKTNLPKQAMEFPDFPFPSHLPSHVHHVDVKNYLDSYSDHFHLQKYIKFNKRVTWVFPKTVFGGDDVWVVKISDVHTKMEEQFEFDAVIVCNGHYKKPCYPRIEGLSTFNGQIIHSQRYRDPEDFRGRRVLVVGGGPSGVDISLDICQSAARTWLSHRFSKKLHLTDRIEQVGEVSRFTFDSAVVRKIFAENDEHADELVADEKGTNIFNSRCPTSNESCLSDDSAGYPVVGPIDVVLFCTGFLHSLPFLSADCGVAVTSPCSIAPLYKDLVCINRPTLAILGLLSAMVPLPIFDCQAQFLVALFRGEISLPSDGERLAEDVKKYEDVKVAFDVDVNKKPFFVPKFQWFYVKHLASIGNFKPLPDCLGDLYKKVAIERWADLANYKDKEYRLGSDGLYV